MPDDKGPINILKNISMGKVLIKLLNEMKFFLQKIVIIYWELEWNQT